MIRRDRDEQAIRMAFGEWEPQQGQPEPDDALHALTEEYRSMRADLALLRDVPECQVSVERLRDAILKAGIRQGPEPRRTWLAPAIATALVLVVGFGLTRRWDPGPNPMPTDLRLAVASPAPEPAAPTLEPEIPVAGVGSRPDHPAAEAPSAAKKPAPRRHRPTRYAVAPKTVVKPSTSSANAASAAVAEPDSLPASEPVVLITPDQDDATGAQRASEMESADHVVIGG